MNILLKRFHSDSDKTLGILYIDGKPECFTLEDEKRDVKVSGETRIQEGEYLISIREDSSPLNEKYKYRFSSFFKGHLMLNDVPNFKYIYIHIGNTDKDTDGCILVGESCYLGYIGNSVDAYKKIYPKIYNEIKKGNKVTIKIQDNA